MEMNTENETNEYLFELPIDPSSSSSSSNMFTMANECRNNNHNHQIPQHCHHYPLNHNSHLLSRHHRKHHKHAKRSSNCSDPISKKRKPSFLNEFDNAEDSNQSDQRKPEKSLKNNSTISKLSTTTNSDILLRSPKNQFQRQMITSMISKADRCIWKVPEKISDPTSLKEKKMEKIDSENMLKQDKKWHKVITYWDYYVKTKFYKIKNLVKKGIPDYLRSKVWFLLLTSHQLEEQQSIQTYLLMGRNKCSSTIEVDLCRTLPALSMFNEPNTINSLRNVLTAYSNKDPEIGYYQGMGYLAAMFLAYLDEEEAFQSFSALMSESKLNIRRIFLHKFSGLEELNLIWENLLQTKFPKVAKHFKELELFPMIYTPTWFISSFLNIQFLPIIKLTIFDRVIAFGVRALLSFALTIIAMNRKFLETASFQDIILYLQYPHKNPLFKDWRNVIYQFDEHWLSQSNFDRLFKNANIHKFY